MVSGIWIFSLNHWTLSASAAGRLGSIGYLVLLDCGTGYVALAESYACLI